MVGGRSTAFLRGRAPVAHLANTADEGSHVLGLLQRLELKAGSLRGARGALWHLAQVAR